MGIREHYQHELARIHAELRALGELAVVAITGATHAFQQGNVEAANAVITNDTDIDHAQYALEKHVIDVIATQQPVAGDLRQLISVIEIASELERIGDYAKGIAKLSIRNAAQSSVEAPEEIGLIAEQAIAMLERALDAFIQQDAAAAQQLSEADDQVDALRKQAESRLIERLQKEPQHAVCISNLLFVTHNLERLADRTTNIGERVVYMVTGSVVALNA